MSQSRQLAAIMFTDIVGYTALMEQDEKKAFEVLKYNLAIHKAAINEFNGRLIKELGDGILASFTTVSDALNAAISIQEQCNENSDFKISIGIHQGEVVFENGDIFGDAVNVASRIQSLGTPGSILFSKKVTEEIKNKSQFQTAYLGSFAFKNVKESIEVFALANNGFPVPRRGRMEGKLKKNFRKRNLKFGAIALVITSLALIGYSRFVDFRHKRQVTAIRNGSIAILPFENQTGRSDLNSIGQVAADFISTNLIQNQFWKVIPTQDVFRQTVYAGVLTNPEAEQKITNQSDLDYLVLGHYNMINDSVLLVASVNDVVENKVLYTTPVIKWPVTNPMKAVTEAQQFILGFLMFSKTEREKLTTRPPKYDAYLAYLKGLELWTKNDIGPGNIGVRTSSAIEIQFKKTISLDEDFIPPYFKLAELFSIDRRYSSIDSVLKILEPKQYLFLESDSLNFTKQKLQLNKNWDALETFLLNNAKRGNSNIRPYYELAVNALYRQNKPGKALNYIAQTDLGQYDFENKPADQLLYYVQVTALEKLRRYEDIEKLVGSFTFRLKNQGIQYVLWKTIYKLRGKDKAFEAFEQMKMNLNQSSLGQVMGFFRYCQIQNDTAGMHYFYARFVKATENIDKQSTWFEFLKSVMLFRIGDTKEAEQLLRENLPVVDRQRRIHMLGLLYAATGRKELAQSVIADLLAHETEFDNGVTRYYVGKVEAGLGNKQSSVNYFHEAIARGCEFRQDLFEFDADLVSLFDYPPFIELVTPKE